MRQDPCKRRGILESALIHHSYHWAAAGYRWDQIARPTLLAELGGMPLAEISRQMGGSRNLVYKLIHDARRRLRRGLEAAGFGIDEISLE